MPKLRTRIELNVGRGFEVQIIEDADRLWIRVSLPGYTMRHLGLWSTKPDAPEHLSYREVVEQLRNRLSGPEATAATIALVTQFWTTTDEQLSTHLRTAASLSKTLQFWPTGWEYWGRGEPMQLREYFDWTFGREMKAIAIDSE